jgi:bifunctional DNA-binding transcriptional regulator/antitoxin component of YhaV-PrlF toxin-antitoxin module
MTATGRLTIPAPARRRIGANGEAQFEIEVRLDAIVLRPVLGREDALARTAQHRRLLKRAHQDSREGRVRRMSERDLARLARRRR